LKWCLNFCCQVPLPDEPDTDDEAKIKKWRWKVKSVQKENRERYSQRCDTELKLTVSLFNNMSLVCNPYSLSGDPTNMGTGSTENEG